MEHETACGQNSGEPRAFPGAEGAQAGFPAVISQAKGQSRVVILHDDRRLCFVLLSRRFYCGEVEWKDHPSFIG